MPQHGDLAYVIDIRDAARAIERFCHRLSLDEFLANDEKQSAVPLKIIVMGEATKRVTREFMSSPPEVPWPGMAGMRDRLVHGCDQWDLDEVWRVATEEIPPLVRGLGALLEAEPT